MSAIAKRTVFVHQQGEYLALLEWTMVQTTCGVMIEPLNLNRFPNDGTAFDLTDEASLITEIRTVDYNQLMGLSPFGDRGTALHGGASQPREGF